MPIIKFEWFKDGMNVTTLSSSSAPLKNRKYRGSLTFSSVKISDATSSYTYLITSVEASFWLNRGDGAIVRIGSNSTNNGNNNVQCSQPISNSATGKWITTVCSRPLWGRYINVQKISSTKSYLSVCELRASYSKEIN